MRVFGGRFGQHMAQQLPDGGKRHIVHDRGRGKAVAKIMQTYIGQGAAAPEIVPPRPHVDRLRPLSIREHKRTIRNSVDAFKDRQCLTVQPDHLRAGLAVRQDKSGRLDPVPSQPLDLAATRAGVKKQPEDRHLCRKFGLLRAQLSTDARVFARGEIPLHRLPFVARHPPARIGALAPHFQRLGIVQQRCQHGYRAVVSRLALACKSITPAHDICLVDVSHQNIAEVRGKVTAPGIGIAFCGRGFPDARQVLEIGRHEIGHGRR